MGFFFFGQSSSTDIADSAVTNAKIASNAAVARSKLASGTASHVIINDSSGNFSSEATLAASRGGTGAATIDAGIRTEISGTGSQVLRRNAANTALEFAAASAGIVDFISSTTLGAIAFSISISAIPTGYKRLICDIMCANDAADGRAITLELNDDATGTNYTNSDFPDSGRIGATGVNATPDSHFEVIINQPEINDFKSFSSVGHSVEVGVNYLKTAGAWENAVNEITKVEFVSTTDEFVVGTKLTIWGMRE